MIVPLAFLLAALWGMTGVWLAFPLSELVVAAVGTAWYWRLNRKGKGR